ncbi:unnamed protein product [Triticum turgidum subsp. durum]|uniref:F-box domain-containing protein n=1 Tax=Triticum turgidum subsp. durum TaxID=4567 RepID=A0A9R0WQY9_TRITD|nr:unnamed protein product [Triticum turgidum subsp. durum]
MEHPQPVTMPGHGVETVLDDLPESIVVDEILVRLPARDIMRCRCVRKGWRSATSADKFMLDHRRRQPFLPVLGHAVEPQTASRLLLSIDAGAGQQQLCPVVRTYSGRLLAALDGLIIVSHGSMSVRTPSSPPVKFFICNPVTRECAPLGTPPSQHGFMHHIAGLYRHQPSGEYRVLWVSTPRYFDRADTAYTTFYYVVAVGSSDIRCIAEGSIAQTTPLETALCKGLPDSSGCPPVHHRGSLHWGLPGRSIVVFNTAAETFWLMGRLFQLYFHQLLEMDGTLALCSVSPEQMTVDVWVVQNYGAETTETWSFKHQINLSGVDDPIPRSWVMRFPRMVVLNNGELLIQFIRGCGPVLHCGIDGKFLGYVKSKDGQVIGLWITKHYLQESLIPLPLSREMREEDSATQGPPFFVGL